MTLWPHQVKNVEQMLWLLAKRMVACDASETGTGKTVVALETAKRFELPFVVVCPKSVRSHWRYWIEELQIEGLCLGVHGWEAMRSGKYPELYDARNWFGAVDTSKKYLVIFDEAHRAKRWKTLNSRMVNRASEQGVYLLLLSATLIQSVLDLAGLAYPLKLVEQRRYWYYFARTFGARIHPRFRGYDDNSTPADHEALRTVLDKIRVRTRREDIAQIIPVLTQTDLLDSAQLPLIRAQYEELDVRVRELEMRGANSAEILTQRLHGRQAIELLKVPMFVEEAETHLEAGFKVALFFNFTQSVREAKRMLEVSYPVGVIDGSTDSKARDGFVKIFNLPLGLRVLVLNVAAGGEGINLQDVHGNSPRVALLSPPESASQLIQACGRIGGRVGARSVGLNRILFVADTVEEEVYKNVARKIDRLENLNDGDLAWKRNSMVPSR
jgi:superfamily II DNA or RNA helicase